MLLFMKEKKVFFFNLDVIPISHQMIALFRYNSKTNKCRIDVYFVVIYMVHDILIRVELFFNKSIK